MAKIVLKPAHPERICWGCDQYCRADDLTCGNGSERTPHPIELFGDDWLEWGREQGAYEGFDPSADVRKGPDSKACELTTEVENTNHLRERALEVLRDVIDPELGINIVDLGLVYRLEADAQGCIDLHLSMTTPACPLGDHLMHEAEERLCSLDGAHPVNVKLVWDPPWTPSRMSESARATLGWTS